jgi:hypothetical protein
VTCVAWNTNRPAIKFQFNSTTAGRAILAPVRPLWTKCLSRVTFHNMKLITRLLTRYWGYLAVVIAVAGFFLHSIGLAVVIALALAALGYFLFQAPMWCGAETRKNEWCRNNSHGLLLGCHIREHKWQRVKQTFTPAGGRTLLRTSRSVSGGLSTIGGVVAGVQVLIAAGVLIFH